MLLAFQLGISYTICVISRDYFGNPLEVPKFSMALIAECVAAALPRARAWLGGSCVHTLLGGRARAPTSSPSPAPALAGRGPWA